MEHSIGSSRDPANPLWWRLRRDLWGPRAIVQPFGAWLLTALLALVIWLTISYAPAAFVEAADDASAVERGVIPVGWGRLAILVVSLIAMMAAIEPELRRLLPAKGFRRTLGPVGAVLNGLYQVPAFVWSLVDLIFAIPLASLAGSSWRSTLFRYVHGSLIISASLLAGLFAPPVVGLPATLLGIALVVAVTRRWSWIERDRERFLIDRTNRKEAQLVGFEQDLRDEALFGLSFLFLLIPLALAQSQALTCASGQCAFLVEGSHELSEDPLIAAWDWLGFFGAELVKSVPFVDWSEVFNVSNDSPIRAATAVGAQLVFLTRATLDLLLLASVLQAVQIAGRLQSQRESFDAKQLPILEPFEERIEFEQAVRAMPGGLGILPMEHPALERVSHYDPHRLQQIATDPEADRAMARLACAILIRRAADDEGSAKGIDLFFSAAVEAEQDPSWRRWMARAATLVEPTRPVDEARAIKVLEATRLNWELRAAAARALGRGTTLPEARRVLSEVATSGNEAKLRADAATALVKLGDSDATPRLERIIEEFAPISPRSAPDREALVTAAYGLSLSGLDRDAILGWSKTEDPVVRFLVERGCRIQQTPMDHHAACSTEPGDDWDQLVRLAPGHEPFPDRLLMGSTDEDPDAQTFEKPQREVVMSQIFGIGRYPVTHEEYRGFTLCVGRAPIGSEAESRLPVIHVSWWDANDYCGWLSRITGDRWRLPRESEWEYACRAGTTTRFAWGDAWDDSKAQSHEMAGRQRPIAVEGEAGSAFARNDWGLWQMHGNVLEWCQDPWNEDLSHQPSDSSELPEAGNFDLAGLRGGSWSFNPVNLRSADRSWFERSFRSYLVGFRIVRTLTK